MRFLGSLLAVLALSAFSYANETTPGHLLIIGGGLLPDNSAVYDRLIGYAAISGEARFGIFPTAAAGTAGAEKFVKNLEFRGIPKAQIEIINMTIENAPEQTSNPVLLAQIQRCTGLIFTGGDQRRIIRALLNSDGTNTAALEAIIAVWRRGGVIAGTSAGAAVQADPMIRVSGLPEASPDQGMDALDFGRTTEPSRRGVLVNRGLGFFRGGLIDQHFSQYRGRLGRLARVAIEEGIRFGFGIDENTALDVAPDGAIEVVGAGHVTVVDSADARCEDGPLGCRINEIRLTCLGAGDRFDPKSGAMTVHQSKTRIAEGAEDNNGNELIPDIAGKQAVLYALIEGLANNTSRKQVGVTFKRNNHYGHGYRFTFRKTDETRSFKGYVNGSFAYTVFGVRLNIEPVSLTLEPPSVALPLDLPEGPSRKAMEALLFRGILLADEHRRFRPNSPISRGELANAIAHTIHIEPKRPPLPQISDVPLESPGAEEIALVVSARLMEMDDQGAFRGSDSITRQEAAVILVKLAEMYGSKPLSRETIKLDDESQVPASNREFVFAAVRSGLLALDDELFHPNDNLTREQAAAAIYRVIGFPW